MDCVCSAVLLRGILRFRWSAGAIAIANKRDCWDGLGALHWPTHAPVCVFTKCKSTHQAYKYEHTSILAHIGTIDPPTLPSPASDFSQAVTKPLDVQFSAAELNLQAFLVLSLGAEIDFTGPSSVQVSARVQLKPWFGATGKLQTHVCDCPVSVQGAWGVDAAIVVANSSESFDVVVFRLMCIVDTNDREC